MPIPPDLAEEWAVDNALDADHDSPFACDDPPADWQPEPMPGEDSPAGSVLVPFSDESPF